MLQRGTLPDGGPELLLLATWGLLGSLCCPGGLQWAGDPPGPRGASPHVSQMLSLSLALVRGSPSRVPREVVGQIRIFPTLCILMPHVSSSKK